MSLGLLAALAVLTYASRAAAVVFLPTPPPRVAAILDRMPAPLFAGLAAIALVEGDRTIAPASTIAALAAAVLVSRSRSMPIILAAGLAAALLTTALT